MSAPRRLDPRRAAKAKRKVTEVIYNHPSRPGSRQGWWYADCPRHGIQQHLDALGGRCVECQRESLGEKPSLPNP